jgi:hypothetical protein
MKKRPFEFRDQVLISSDPKSASSKVMECENRDGDA